jgi:hypothetical protein
VEGEKFTKDVSMLFWSGLTVLYPNSQLAAGPQARGLFKDPKSNDRKIAFELVIPVSIATGLPATPLVIGIRETEKLGVVTSVDSSTAVQARFP